MWLINLCTWYPKGKLLYRVWLFVTPRTIHPWDSPGKNTGVGSLSLLQGIFPTQISNPGPPHCRQILYQLSYQRSPRILEWVAYPFSSGSSWPESNQGVLHYRMIPYQLSYQGKQKEEGACPLSTQSGRPDGEVRLCPWCGQVIFTHFSIPLTDSQASHRMCKGEGRAIREGRALPVTREMGPQRMITLAWALWTTREGCGGG